MRVIVLALMLGWILIGGGLPAAEGDDQADSPAVAEQVRQSLQQLDPGWYDGQRDSWRRVVLLADEAEENDAESGSWLGEATVISNIFSWLLLIILVSVLAALVAALVMGSRQPLAPRQVSNQRSGLASLAESEDPLAAPRFLDLDLNEVERADLVAALQAALAGEDWLRAVICAFAARLVLLDRSGGITLRPGATNRQLLRELGERLGRAHSAGSALYRDLRRCIHIFEQVYFGGRQPGASLARELGDIDAFKALLAELDGGSGGRL